MSLPTFKVRFFSGVVMLLILVASERSFAQDETRYTVITGTGQSLLRIAIPPGINNGSAAKEAKLLQTVMMRDFELVGWFKVLSPKGFLANLSREGTGIDLQDWVNIGAQAVIKSKATRRGNHFGADFYLYDLGKGSSPVLKKSYKGSAKSARLLAHRFGDEVVKYFTSERGVFTTKVAFASGNRRAKQSQIFVMDFDGHGVHKVSRIGRQNVLPAWSSTGMLAFTGYLWRNPDLYIMPSSGGRAKRISKHQGLNTGAAWSPRGDSIALTLSKDGNAEIYLISTSGKILRRLTNHPGIDTSPAWSPDGSQLAFVSNRGGSPQIYIMSSTGGGVKRLTFQGNYNQEPDWCPRKETPLIAFTGRDEKGIFDIFTVNIKTGEVKRLTQGQGSNASPSWAPNGRLLVYSSTKGGIYIMDSDGLNQHKIYSGFAETPKWSK